MPSNENQTNFLMNDEKMKQSPFTNIEFVGGAFIFASFKNLTNGMFEIMPKREVRTIWRGVHTVAGKT